MKLRTRHSFALPAAIWGGAIAAAIALIALTLATSFSMRDRELAQARRNTTTIATLAEHYVLRTVGAAELVMLTLARELGASPASSDRRAAVEQWFADAVKELPQIEAARIIDLASGEATFEAKRSREIDLGAPSAMAAISESASLLIIGKPIHDQTTGRWLLPMMRRIDAPRDDPGRAVVVYITLGHAQSYLENIAVGRGIAAVMHRNGSVIARNPFDSAMIGRVFANARLYDEIKRTGPNGSYESQSASDGVERIVSYRALENAPLVVFISYAKDDVLSEWRANLSYNLCVAGLAALTVLCIGGLLARAAKQRAKTEKLLVTTLTNIDQGVLMIGSNGRVEAYNQRALALLGLPDELFRRRPMMVEVFKAQIEIGEFDDLSPERRAEIVVDTPEGLLRNYERVRPNGLVLDIRTIALADGGAVRTYTDVTAQRRVLQVMTESEARYRVLADNTTDMIVRMGLDLRRRYISPASTDLLGYPPEELLDMSPVEIMHPDDRHAFAATLAEIAAGARDRATSLSRSRRKDGAWIWCEAQIRLVRNAAGAPFEIIAAVRDVEERQRRAEELRAAKERAEGAIAELAKREQRYRDMVDLMPQKVWIARANGDAVYYNKQMTRYHGSIGADPQNRLRMHHQDDAERVAKIRTEAIAQGAPFEVETRIANKDGQYRWHRISMAPLKREDGSIIDWVGTSLDIDDLRRAQAALEAAKAAAESASAAKTNFLATMSHEIRTPLNAVIGLTGGILDRHDLAPDLRRPIELIKASGSALLTIINDVLDFSKIEAGKLEFRTQPFALRGLVEDCIDLIRSMADSKSLALSLRCDFALSHYVAGDDARLRQVLLNLLNNAVKFTSHGGVTISVERAASDHIRFSIADTGIGVPWEKQALLFRDFSQIDSSTSRQFGGTGLGLAICRRLVEGMGGEIGVNSTAGEGSTFYFTLPLPETEAPSPSVQLALVSDGSRPRILVVDDIEINRMVATDILRAAGHEVDALADAPAAIAAIQRNAYDLIFMDVQMPGMDGVEATKMIRALDDPAATTPIIALTAHAFDEQIDEFIRAGMDGHVGKPFARETLLKAVAAHARQRGPEQEPARVSADNPLRELLDIMGRDKVSDLLAAFAADLAGCFERAEREQLREEAHRTISSAGMLGFTALSNAARALEDACSAGEALDIFLREARRLKAEGTAAIESGAWLAAEGISSNA